MRKVASRFLGGVAARIPVRFDTDLAEEQPADSLVAAHIEAAETDPAYMGFGRTGFVSVETAQFEALGRAVPAVGDPDKAAQIGGVETDHY